MLRAGKRGEAWGRNEESRRSDRVWR
jgi:hypothetical protein